MRTAPSTSETFTNEREGGERLIVSYTNWGEPYVEGVRLSLCDDREEVTVSLTRREVERLHAFLGRLLPTLR